MFNVVGMGESHPRLPHAFKDAIVLSAGDRYQELVRASPRGLAHSTPTPARA